MPQLAEDGLDVALHLGDGAANSVGAVNNGRKVLGVRQFADGHRIDVGRKQKRADVVMQVAGEFDALFFLHRLELFVQPMIAMLHFRKTNRHVVEAGAQLCKLARCEDGDAGAIVAIADTRKPAGQFLQWPRARGRGMK
ncbi:MAG: hypothetical protein WDN29_03710 [Methylovirgula sp.]